MEYRTYNDLLTSTNEPHVICHILIELGAHTHTHTHTEKAIFHCVDLSTRQRLFIHFDRRYISYTRSIHIVHSIKSRVLSHFSPLRRATNKCTEDVKKRESERALKKFEQMNAIWV